MQQSRTPYLVGKAFRSFLLASVLTAAASQVATLVDGLMLSHFVNEEAMSAVNITSPVNQVLFAICILLGVGGSMLAGIAIGNHRRDEASRLFSVVTTSAVSIGIVAAVAGMVWLSPLVGVLCPDSGLQPYVDDYLGVSIIGSPVYMLMVVMQTFVTLDGEPRRVTAAVATSTVVNLCLDYITIVPLDWGITGAAVSTVVSYVAALGVLLPHFRKAGTLTYSLPRRNLTLRAIASMGMPFGIATVLIAVQMLGNNLVAMDYLGAAGIVTLSVCMYMLRFSMIILTGTLESFQPVAAILKGSGDNNGVALVLGRAYRFLGVSLAALAFVLILFPGLIETIFGIDDPASVSAMDMALPAYALNIVLQCAVYLLIPVYQIYSHRSLALVISFGQPLLPMLCFWGLSALSTSGAGWLNPWWGFALGQIAVVLILLPLALTRRGNHRRFVLIPRDNPDSIFDTTVKPSLPVMGDALVGIDSWLASQGIGDTLRHRVVLAVEENVKNIIEHASGKRTSSSAIDVRISITPETIRAMIRDEGIPFNPIEQDPGTGIGLKLVRDTSDSEKYEYIFHQNLLTVEWNR